MTTHLVFLRAVNVGQRTYPMARLRAAVEAAGFEDVATHIQTGNLRLCSDLAPATVQERLERVLAADSGFEVPAVVLSPAELTAVVETGRSLSTPAVTRHHVELLRCPPATADVAVVEGQSREGQRFVVRDRAVHLLLRDVGFHEVRPAPAAVRRALGVSTNRNLRVLEALVARWC